jgi:maltose O-acetyltransferase
MGEMHERMLRGEFFMYGDPDTRARYNRIQELLARFDATAPAADAERLRLLEQMLRSVGKGVNVRPPFFCEHGEISIDEGTFVNTGAVMLDICPISIGARCQFGPRVQLLAATHPVDPDARRAGWEYGAPITIEDNVWLGGGVIVCPGVRIGQNTVVGAGAVVTRDLPADVVAAGVPARVLRRIGPKDRGGTPPVPAEP